MIFIKDNKAGMVYKFFDQKKGFGTIATSIAGASLNEELAQELPKPVFEILKRRKVFARFKDNIWAVDLAEIKPFFPFNLIAKYLLCLIEIFTKYACVKPLKDKKAKALPHGFIEIVTKF